MYSNCEEPQNNWKTLNNYPIGDYSFSEAFDTFKEADEHAMSYFNHTTYEKKITKENRVYYGNDQTYHVWVKYESEEIYEIFGMQDVPEEDRCYGWTVHIDARTNKDLYPSEVYDC